jgi:hypothetical protein
VKLLVEAQDCTARPRPRPPGRAATGTVRLPRARAIVLPILLLACSQTGRVGSGTPVSSGGAPQVARVTAGETSDLAETLSEEEYAAAKRLEHRRCQQKTCCVSSLQRAGTSRQGHALAVALIESTSDCLISAVRPERPPAEELELAERYSRCQKYYLVDLTEGGEAGDKWLAAHCDHQKQETAWEVDVDAKTLDVSEHSLFSSHVTHQVSTIGLDPLRWVETASSAQWFEHGYRSRWNWDDFGGEVTLGLDYCAGKRPPGIQVLDTDGSQIEVDATTIPRVTVPAGFVADGWKTTALARCAARVDGSSRFVQGLAGETSDATLRVLFSSTDELFLEIEDDHFTRGKAIHAGDHVQLWFAAEGEQCVDPGAQARALEWKLRSVDGKVFPGPGNAKPVAGKPPAAPATEVARDGRRLRLKVRFDPIWLSGHRDRMTIVYADSDDGLGPERLLPTSAFIPGKWWTLGEFPDGRSSRGPAGVPSCEPEHGELVPRIPAHSGLPPDD